MVKLLLGSTPFPRRTTWPTRSRWRSATCTARGDRSAEAIDRATGRSTALRSWRHYRRVIARLKGTLVEKSPNRLVVDVGGVGYDVLVPLSTFYGLGDAGSGVTLRIHTHVREDVIALYGFGTASEQDLFERLIAVSGIGPKLALAVLSGIDAGELVRAIRTQDVARLTRIPGIGKKTAERIGLELKDRLPHGCSRRAAIGAERPVDRRSAPRRSAVGADQPGLSAPGGREGDRRNAEASAGRARSSSCSATCCVG